MPRINPVNTSDASPQAQKLLDGVQRSLGVTPNLMSTMAHSPAVLQAYLAFGQGIGQSELSAAIREQIAVAIAGENSCGYCASAHTALGSNAGVSQDELALNLDGRSTDTRVQAALDFARSIVKQQGWIDDDELEAVRDAGFSEGEIVEVIAVVAINIFTNYFNHIAQTDIDFPEVVVPEPVLA